MMNRFFKLIYFTLVFVFLYLPIFIIILYSFNNANFSALWHGITWKWYRLLFSDSAILSVTVNSLVVGALAATFATAIGTLGAVTIFKYRFFGRKLLHGLIFILIIVPDLVFGISLLVLYSMLHLHLGFWTLLLAHVTFCIPFVMVTVYARLKDTNKHLFEAARDLGATELTVFWRIILPLMVPAIISGWLLSFTLSIDDVIISFFVTGSDFQILPLYIYSAVHIGVTPEVNALVSLIFVATVTIVLTAYYFLRKQHAKMG
ncbi:MAG: spermidine/putrescine ABC transporter permease PotC [Gammaproteobacteria bacterium RIFCSPHIGHO2_02_FULL_42_13]|nr:MAG: spermidine/putrescine ABC transporter permease PotC [Gammaproteobacteria bacterium RIFCSPHIGHO2_02_FULL_42_13]OGT68823.1 MAG: spermidine/putrescine ABC transporter permease PotC [Gammaproteobacteria bacterium RIFCSPLOWO2_02_FULL_42_9]